MEAACTAAEVGCKVFLLEKKDHIGGLSSFISNLPSKTRMKDFPKYLENRASKLDNLYTFLNTEANVELIKKFKPNIIVNATGSVPHCSTDKRSERKPGSRKCQHHLRHDQ